MKLATITASNTAVRVLAVNGGWTQVEIIKTGEVTKVRNGALSDHREEKAVKPVKVARERIAIEDRKNGKVDPLYLQFYQSYTTTLADGTKKRSIDKGDDVALRMRALDLDGVYEYAAEVTGSALSFLRDRFAHLNPGMQRMSLGNMVRKHFKEEMETA